MRFRHSAGRLFLCTITEGASIHENASEALDCGHPVPVRRAALGAAMADTYNLHVEDFGDRVMPYCEQFVLIAGYNQVYNEADIAVDGDNTSMTIAAARQAHPRRC